MRERFDTRRSVASACTSDEKGDLVNCGASRCYIKGTNIARR